ncbi:murein L,D-transpeptidase catalytic domain family protein [Sphingomonas baiyangensis]|uniref:Murein L,D-transpeptidase catalytic domain family protein n=1 Tax=Sphingomonas baiyangensis TaxID=2572576 RepID=A0A4U1L364_9SPHN|nr:murein L,D-transpeptidase catalytic domain family protein [Sphingomonas baiyangensis]TKD50643.1 murein L,D-transpeptidase catalytic domain family protein [Sphingomonas baiyangensis]
MLTEAASRRRFLRIGAGLAAMAVVPGCVSTKGVQTAGRTPPRPTPPAEATVMAPPPPRPVITHASGVAQPLFERAMAARAGNKAITQQDRIAIIDFAPASFRSRLYLIDVTSGRVQRHLVSHGSGSDPGHTGFLQRFSNEDGSEATCEGAFATSDYYVGQHGRSQRLLGLDPTNSNAFTRAIVVHGAWYAEKDMLVKHGKLGRSQGCFAVGDSELQRVFDHLGEGALIYAGKA